MAADFIDHVENYAIFRMNPEGCVSTWNTGAEQIKGYTEEEIRGTHYRVFFSDEAVNQGTPQQLLARAESEGSVKGRGWRVRKDGSRFWADFTLTALFDEAGEHRGYAKVARDITEQHRYEQRLEQQNEELEEFASRTSHDLKNPLVVAQGKLELAREECENPNLDDAAHAVERSLDLVDTMLTLARDEDGASEAEPVSLAETVKWCWRTIDTSDETLVVETDQTVTAVPPKLERIVDNLLANAVEHGGEGSTVTVGDLENGFYIADSGPGIPEEERSRVFDDGYSDGDGTGLGLHIVQEDVAAQGWTISITESAAGGARFEIRGV